MNLPAEFQKRMTEQLGEEEFQKYLACFEQKVSSAIRVNTLKCTPQEFCEHSPFSLRPVPWIQNGYYYDDADVPSKHPFYYAGLYYLQEPSAMTPANLLPIEEGDTVLDLCAAPGGKSTELAARLRGKGLLISNDISNSRAKALLKNIELFGVANAIVMSEPSDKLASRFPAFFDKILVDAPCSGEGMFRKQPAIMKNWEQYGTEYYNDLQKQILPNAYRMLKPGGYLLYSTCTFSPMEDEETVKFLLDSYDDLELADAVPPAEKERYAAMGFETGRKTFMKEPVEGIEKTVRLFPHKLEGEGHFVALFRKKENDSCIPVPLFTDFVKPNRVPKELTEFLSHVKLSVPVNRLYCVNDSYYAVPEGAPALNGMRILRTGLLLGEVHKERFEPSQALAMALSPETYDNCLELSLDDRRVCSYLKCESIECPEVTKDGYVLVCAEHYPLGFGKVKNGQFKNRYLPGWRMM